MHPRASSHHHHHSSTDVIVRPARSAKPERTTAGRAHAPHAGPGCAVPGCVVVGASGAANGSSACMWCSEPRSDVPGTPQRMHSAHTGQGGLRASTHCETNEMNGCQGARAARRAKGASCFVLRGRRAPYAAGVGSARAPRALTRASTRFQAWRGQRECARWNEIGTYCARQAEGVRGQRIPTTEPGARASSPRGALGKPVHDADPARFNKLQELGIRPRSCGA